MLQQNQQHHEGPHPPLPQSLPAPTIRKRVPEHQSPLHQTAQQLFPQAVRALKSDHPAPLWNPMQTPTSWNMDHPPTKHPPTLPHQRKKTVNFFVQFKCATHRWVGLYKQPVAAHSPLCTRHFSYTIPQKTQQYMYVYMLMHYHKSFCTVPQLAAWLTMFLSAHVQYLCEAFA